MSKSIPQLVKPTLDKDLEKLGHVETASQHVARRLAAPGISLIFLVLAMIFAGVYVVDSPRAAVIIAAAAIAAYMAINIGANDVTNNVSAAVGARAMSMTTALCIAAIFEIAGAMIAGGDVITTISSSIVVPGAMPNPTATIWAMMAALLAAALWVNLATWINAPVSTTHTIVGGVLGAGMAAAGADAIGWNAIGVIAASWVISPLLGGLIAILFLAFIKETIIYREDKIAAARTWVPVLIAVMAGAFCAYLALTAMPRAYTVSTSTGSLIGLGAGIAIWAASVPFIRRQSVGLENRNQSLRVLFRIPLIFSAALLSFAHGANDVSNAVGPLSAIVQAAASGTVSLDGDGPIWVTIIGALGISAGVVLFGPRLIRLVGSQITKLNPMRAYCVALSAALTVIVASWLGLPVSSTHIAVGSVFGVGLFREWYTRNSRRRMRYMRSKAADWDVEEKTESNPDEQRRRYLVRRSHLMSILAAWIVTVPISAALAAVMYWIMVALFV